MNTQFRWKSVVVGGAALMLTLGAVALYPQVTQAQTTTPDLAQQAQESTLPVAPEQRGRGGLMDADHDALLAEALGITAEELQAAYTTAAEAAIAQAVEADLLTQTQADALLERLASADGAGFGRFGLGHIGRFGNREIDFAALLADALGITPEELEAAQAKAQEAAIDQAVEDGNLTQEQADLAKAWQAFRAYVAEQQPTIEEQLAQAVEAGAITQEQADLLLENQQDFGGMRGRGMMPGMDGGMGGRDFGPGMGGRGMDGRGHGHDFRGMPFGAPQDQGDQESDGESQGNSDLLVPAASF